MTKEEMATKYDMLAGAHSYLVGFAHHDHLYYFMANFAELTAYLKLDRASSKRGGMAKLRVRVSSEQRHQLVASGKAQLLGTADLLEAEARYNKGENFEKLVTEQVAGERWEKDNKPFWECGDVRLGGVEVQVKFDNAELTNEKTLGRRLAMLAAA